MGTDSILLMHFIERHPVQAAQLLEGIEDKETSAFLEEISPDAATELISLMNGYKAARCLETLNTELAVEILEKSDTGTAVSILRQTEKQIRQEWLQRITPEISAKLHQKMQYPANSVGAIMHALSLTLREDMMVKDAIEVLKIYQDKTPVMVYVVDEQGRLAGGLNMHKLLFAEMTAKIAAFVNTEIPKISAALSLQAVSTHHGWRKYHALPVVDDAEKLIGELSLERVLENTVKTDQGFTKEVIETSTALGELYRIGLTGFLQSFSELK